MHVVTVTEQHAEPLVILHVVVVSPVTRVIDTVRLDTGPMLVAAAYKLRTEVSRTVSGNWRARCIHVPTETGLRRRRRHEWVTLTGSVGSCRSADAAKTRSHVRRRGHRLRLVPLLRQHERVTMVPSVRRSPALHVLLLIGLLPVRAGLINADGLGQLSPGLSNHMSR